MKTGSVASDAASTITTKRTLANRPKVSGNSLRYRLLQQCRRERETPAEKPIGFHGDCINLGNCTKLKVETDGGGSVKAFMNEFREFVSRGNVMDLAVAVIIGGAFGLIVKSLTDDIIMPIIGAIFGGFDFADYFIPLSSSVTADTLAAAREQGAVFAYGNFLSVVINFLILAIIIFMMVKGVNSLKRKQEEKPAEAPAPPADIQLLTEIRDLLKK